MAKLTFEEVYRGEKYNVMGNAFKELISLYEDIGTLEDLQTTAELLVCKHTLIAAKKIIDEGDSILDILELQLPSLRKEGNDENTRRILVREFTSERKEIPQAN